MADDTAETTYPVSKQLNITFSPYEDRLILQADRGPHGRLCLLLTRRMVMLVLQQLLNKLPEMSDLDKTPSQYWQDVLKMSHQQAMDSKRENDETAREAASGSPETTSTQTEPATHTSDTDKSAMPDSPPLYLATELSLRHQDKELYLAFKGLPIPQAMTHPCAHEPVLATPLQVEHVHQLLELLISKAQDAHWHLPVNLPWMDSGPGPKGAVLTSQTH
ncbi:hypothetical protein [Nitrincola alkalilacustris]|uniref:hypothetical protein n=1 Tax=Nitrincola alkalilacustris TaxID=1571224 RepID=UPI00124E1C28|nr:hypothetical protein [Nitrincola alkalilacustris]